MTPRRVSPCLVAVLVLALAPSARAQEEAPEGSEGEGASSAMDHDEDARLHFELGRRAYARADYETAAAEFERSFALSERAELHYNLFLVYHELGRDEEAVRALRAYLPHEDDPETRAHLEARLTRLEAAMARPESVVVEDAPPDQTLELGGDVVVAPELVAEVAQGGGGELGVAGAALLGLGGATLLVTAITGGMAMGERSALEMRCAPTCSEGDVATGRALALTSDVTLGAGLGLAVVGTVLLIVHAGAPSDDAPPLTTWVSPSGGGAALTGRF